MSYQQDGKAHRRLLPTDIMALKLPDDPGVDLFLSSYQDSFDSTDPQYVVVRVFYIQAQLP